MKIIAGLIVVLALATAAYFWLSHTQNSPNVTEVATSTNPIVPDITLKSVQLTFSTGKSIALDIAKEYEINIAAEGYRHLRFMAWSPDHRLFVGEMASASDDHTGRVIVLDNFNTSSGIFESSNVYLDNLRNPNSVAFYTDHAGTQWIYIALTDKLIRYTYHPGDTAPVTTPEIIATFPDSGPPASQGGWHLTRTLAFKGDSLFVSVGSGCNSCEEENIQRADIEVMNPDGTDRRVYASGLRNAVGLVSAQGVIFATANEADHLGTDKPNDVIYKITDGANYGWPYCYEFNGSIFEDSSTSWKHPIDCSVVPHSWAELPAHSAPLGLRYIDSAFRDSRLRDSILVAMHGSGKPALATGYAVAMVRENMSPKNIVTGFLQNGTRVGRSVDVLQNDDRSFFITDDLNGALYYLRFTQ